MLTVRVDVSGVGIEYEVTGEGRPVVLLHGFPDSGRLWRHQVPALIEAGFKVIVPDMRGYGRSDKPTGKDAYTMDLLVGDVLAVIDAAGADRAHVVGHDWGAGVAWATALMAAERVDHLVAMSVGHPATFFIAGFEQYEKSWYMLLFQFEEIAEQWLSADDWANFRAWGQPPRHGRGNRRAGGKRLLDSRPELLSSEHPPRALPAVRLAAATDPGPNDGRVELRGLRAHRGADDQVGRNVSGPWRYERLDGPGTGCSSRRRMR